MILHTYRGAGLNPWGYQHSRTYSHVEPGCDEYAAEAWERMTTGGCSVVILPKHAEPVDPGGIDRFREPTPPGGLRLVSWDDAAR